MSKFNPKDHLIMLHGKSEYLEVKWRIVWFREDHKTGVIETEIVADGVFKATVKIDGAIVSTGHGSANAGNKRVVWTGREIEKAETAAIGRALAHAGYGTQFTDEVEGDYLADSPVKPSATKPRKPKQPPAPATHEKTTQQFAGMAEELNGVVVKDTKQLLKQYHILGKSVYGEEWSKKRKDLQGYYGRESSKDLTFEELTKIIAGLRKKESK